MKNCYKATYVKECSCDSESKTGTTETEVTGNPGRFIITTRFYPGPVCEKCGRPWDWRGSQRTDLTTIDPVVAENATTELTTPEEEK